jgi:hypothetical protein
VSVADAFFTERRRVLHRALAERSIEIAGLYRSAIRELSRPVEYGEDASHVGLICHSMREFMLGLPGVVSNEVRKRDHDASTLAHELPGIVNKYPDLDLNLELQDVPVPQELARQLRLIVDAEREADGRIKANARLLLTGDAGLHSSEVTTWLDAYRYFQGRAHWDRGQRSKPLPSDSRLNDKIALVEDLMEPRVRPFLEGRPTIDRLLARINGEIEGEVDG